MSLPPIRFLPVLLAGLILAAGSSRGQTLLFDFGGGNTTLQGDSPDDPENAWNNITGAIATIAPGQPAAQLNAAVTTANEPTSINLVMVTRFNGVNENGTQALSLYPIDATRDSLYGNTESWNSLTDIYPSFKLTGLDPGFNHTLTFYASRISVSDNRETLYTVSNGTDSVEVALDASNNINGTVAVELIKPSAAGELTVSLAPGPNNTNANHFTYLGVLKLELIPAQQLPVIFTDEPDDETILLGRPVTFRAAVNSTPPYTIQWMKDDVVIEEAPSSFTYTIPATTPDMDNTRYSVKVSNLQFTATSRKALLRVSSDLTPPAIVSASSLGPFHLAIVFSEEMDAVFASEPTNYLIDGGNIFVASAVLQPDRKTVVLAPGQPMTGTTVLAVSNVTDLAGNSIQPDSPTSAVIPQPDGKSFLIDFGATATSAGGGNNDPLNYWNNVTGGLASADGSVLSDLVRNNNEPTGVSLTIASRFNNANGNGTVLPGPFPVNATRDTLYGNTTIFNDLVDIYPVIRLGGLNPAEEHDIVFYGSRMEAGDNRETRYTVTGATETFVDYNVANNILNTAVVNGMRPDGSGDITIALTPGPNNNNANRFTYLGVLKVTPRASTGPLEMLQPVIRNNRIILNWIGTGALEWSTSLTPGPWTAIVPAPTSPYSEDLVPGQRKFFRLRP